MIKLVVAQYENEFSYRNVLGLQVLALFSLVRVHRIGLSFINEWAGLIGWRPLGNCLCTVATTYVKYHNPPREWQENFRRSPKGEGGGVYNDEHKKNIILVTSVPVRQSL